MTGFCSRRGLFVFIATSYQRIFMEISFLVHRNTISNLTHCKYAIAKDFHRIPGNQHCCEHTWMKNIFGRLQWMLIYLRFALEQHKSIVYALISFEKQVGEKGMHVSVS